MAFNFYMLSTIIGFISFLIAFYLYIKEKSLNQQYLFLEENYREIKESNRNLELSSTILKTRYEEEQKSSIDKFKVLKDAKDELSNEFKLLANKIFEDKAKQFSSSNKEQLELLLKPFREQITNFSLQTKEQFIAQTKEGVLLKDELSRLRDMNSQLSNDALNLTNALKGENKTQGNWGEIVLESILEQSGLRKDVEYELQATLKSEEGKSYRPDVIVHMPQERDIIIDSKVSLVAYERFINANDDKIKSDSLKEHILSMKTHVKGLSEKKYEKLEGVNTLDFVLLFMPIEGAFLLALEHDGEFFKSAYEQNILVVSPSTLLVTLRTIEHIWRTQRQEEHALKIATEAEGMYEKLVGFVDEMQKIGTHLNKAQESYDKSMNRLHTGRGNVIKKAENIVKLGIKPKKVLSIKSEEE